MSALSDEQFASIRDGFTDRLDAHVAAVASWVRSAHDTHALASRRGLTPESANPLPLSGR